MLSWFEPPLNKNSDVLNNFEAFIIEFSSTFEESNQTIVAQTKIKNL